MKLPGFEPTGFEGKVIEHLREERNLSLREFSYKIGRTPQYLRIIERGKVLTWPVLRDLTSALEVSPWVFFLASEKRSAYKEVRLSNLPKKLTDSLFSSPEMFRDSIGHSLSFIRTTNKMSQNEFANLIRVEPRSIPRLEGGVGRLTLGIVQETAARFNLPMWYFFLIADRASKKDAVTLSALGEAIPDIASFRRSSTSVLDTVVLRSEA